MVTPPQVLNKERKGMRLLLISDTHGKLDIINELSAQTQADAVIHAGDFGFYKCCTIDKGIASTQHMYTGSAAICFPARR